MIERNRLQLDEFLCGFVHKLEDTLSSIIVQSQLLLLKIADPVVKEELEKIIRGAIQVSQIVKIHLAYREKAKKDRVDESDRSDNC
jgi:hypothetical protein